MDRTTVFTKTAKGLMEATGKTSHLSRDIRAVLKEVDGRATVELLQTRLGKLSEAKLQEALETLMKDDFVREFSTAPSSVAPTTARTAPPPSRAPAAGGDEDLDFTSAIPSAPAADKRAEEAARQKAQAAAAAAAAARAKAAAEAAARAKAEAEAKAKAQAAARAKAEAEAKAKAEAAARAKAEAEARAKREAEERARKEAEDRARKEAEEKARREADELRAKLEQERKAREEAERKAKEEAARERRAAEEKARREADELRAKLEEERKAREEAERKAKEEAERERRAAEEKARREADELRAKLEEERKAREEAERRAKEEAERERRAAEEKARREADELRAKLEQERKAREEAERKAKEEAERRAREEAERVRLETEEKARREAEEQARIDAEARARRETEDAQSAREEAEREAREQAERERREAEDRTRREAEETAARAAEEQARKQAEARRQAEEKARIEAEEAERRAREEAERQARERAERERREAEDRARRETEEKAERERREAEEKAAQPPPAGSALDDLVKIETDFDAVLKASVGAPQEAAKRAAGPDDQLQKAAEELERRQAEEQARAAEEKARAQAKAEAEAKAKQAEEEESRKGERQERPKAAPLGVEEHLSSHAEAQALLDEQNAETERHFADMEKELDAEQVAAPAPKKAPEPQEPAPKRKKKEAKESARAAAAATAAAAVQAREAEFETEPIPAPYRPRINWGKPVALGLFLLVVLGLVAVNFISFDGSIPQFEKAASAYLQQPVKIKALHLSLVPRPHWRLDGVSVGNEGELKVAQVNAVAEFGSMFSDKKAFSSIELESPVLGEQGFLGLLFGKPAGRDFKVANIVAKNAKLESKTFILPALDAKIAMGADGAWQKIALETPDHKTSLTLKPEGEGAALEVETNAFSLPFHPAFILENFVASGQIGRGELRLNEFKGGIFDGYLSGNAKLKWGADWSLDGAISVRAMDPGKFVPALLDQGRLEGKAAYSMRAKSYDELFESPRLEGTFDILKGNLLGVDLGRMLQGGGAGGKTAYAELSGSFLREAGRIQLRQLSLVSGPVSAGGSAEVDAGKRINGRFAVELKSPVAHARTNLTLSGTLQEPHFSR